MTFRDKSRRRLLIMACLASALSVFLAGPSPARGDTADGRPLDEETVFCIYHWMSRETIDDQDLEALSRATGHPTYSNYKPSEMFIRTSLHRLRARLKRIMGGFDKTTRFVGNAGVDEFVNGRLDLKGLLPPATPYIFAEYARGSVRRLNTMIRRALAANGKTGGGRLAVIFEPVGVRRAGQRRNIALEPVRLPIRSVVLKPVRVIVCADPTPFQGPLAATRGKESVR